MLEIWRTGAFSRQRSAPDRAVGAHRAEYDNRRYMLRRLGAALLFLVYFFWNARGCVTAPFTRDDMMNIYGAFESGIGQLAKAAALFWLPVYRPFGGVLYLAVYHSCGLNPAGFRVLCVGLLLMNGLLVYALCLRIRGRPDGSSMAVLLSCFHIGMADLYYNSGTLYDIACAFFLCLATYTYISIRLTGPLPIRWYAMISAMMAAALGAKEIAVTLPAVIALSEWLLNGRRGNYWFALFLCVPAAIFAWSRSGGSGPLAGVAPYDVKLSLDHALACWGRYLDQIFLAPDGTVSPIHVLLALTILACGA